MSSIDAQGTLPPVFTLPPFKPFSILRASSLARKLSDFEDTGHVLVSYECHMLHARLHALSRFTLLAPRPQSKCTFRTPLFSLPQPPRLFASRVHSQVPSPGDSETKRRQWIGINHIITSVRRLLDQGKNEEAVEFFKSHLSETPSEDRSSHFGAYERGINVFLNHKLYKSAVEFDQLMYAERMFSSSGFRARMLVCSDIVTAPHKRREELEPLYAKLSHLLSLSSYSERSLRKLLDVMRGHPLIDSQFVRNLVDVYVKSRGSKYELESRTINKLIVFYTRAGSMDIAKSLVLRKPADNYPRKPNLRPYTTLISELTNKGAMSSKHLTLLLDSIGQSHTSVDLPFMNALVQSAVRQGNFHQAFSIYESILRDPASHMIPDSFTFGSLFNALQRLWARRPKIRRARQPPNAPTPRQLFRQMLECHVLTVQSASPPKGPRKPPVVRVSTLNVALRQFMLSLDYPGAFVTLQTFRGLYLRPDVRSYRIVFTILLAHTEVSLRPEPWRYVRWAANFLGNKGRAGVQPEDFRPEVAYALLEFARGVGDTRFRTPEVAVILGEEEGPKNAKYDIEPLERLVGRAILATKALSGVGEGQAERALQQKLAPYFYEMVPDALWEGRRLRRVTC